MPKWKKVFVLVFLGFIVLACASSQPAEAALAFALPSGFDLPLSGQSSTSLYFFSEPGDYIGQGLEWYYNDPAANFTAGLVPTGGGALQSLTFHFDNFSIVDFWSSTWWDAQFAAPYFQDPAVGFYDGATRYPFEDPASPGLSVSGDGRGCNQSGGRFEIVDLEYGAGSSVDRLDAFFAQYCENESGVGSPALFGRVRFNEPVVLEPSSLALFGLGALGLIGRRPKQRIQ